MKKLAEIARRFHLLEGVRAVGAHQFLGHDGACPSRLQFVPRLFQLPQLLREILLSLPV